MFIHHRGWIFLGIVSFLFLATGQAILGRQGLLLGFLAASALNFYIYIISEKMIFNFFKAEQLEGQDAWGVTSSLAKASENFQSYPPQVYLTKINSPLIFCTSRGWGKSKIILSEALLDKLTKEEIQDLLTIHMLYLLSLSSFFIGFRTQFAEIIYVIGKFLDTVLSLPYIFSGQEKRIVFFQKLLLPLGTLFIQSQKKTLFSVDSRAAKIIGSKERFAKLLWKLQGLIQTKPFPAPPSPVILFVINPLTTDGLDKYFQKHLGLDIRIKNLIGHYPM
jgi:heat shock protein HtpX